MWREWTRRRYVLGEAAVVLGHHRPKLFSRFYQHVFENQKFVNSAFVLLICPTKRVRSTQSNFLISSFKSFLVKPREVVSSSSPHFTELFFPKIVALTTPKLFSGVTSPLASPSFAFAPTSSISICSTENFFPVSSSMIFKMSFWETKSRGCEGIYLWLRLDWTTQRPQTRQWSRVS